MCVCVCIARLAITGKELFQVYCLLSSGIYNFNCCLVFSCVCVLCARIKLHGGDEFVIFYACVGVSLCSTEV